MIFKYSAVSENESESDEEIDDLAEDELEHDNNVNGAGFQVVMTTSNVNNTCHGVVRLKSQHFGISSNFVLLHCKH